MADSVLSPHSLALFAITQKGVIMRWLGAFVFLVVFFGFLFFMDSNNDKKSIRSDIFNFGLIVAYLAVFVTVVYVLTLFFK